MPGISVLSIKKKNCFLKAHLVSSGLGKVDLGVGGRREENTGAGCHVVGVVAALIVHGLSTSVSCSDSTYRISEKIPCVSFF